uniref:Large ribosomal subunit protein bL20c n=1 Tax=Gracilaria vermiculophylla TaxID=2608709 RepID=A0A345U910_9FLOR|nr:ribosomal protein L20 [Gracilaria vermiculophylla]AXI96946.1 ribosomal protein L20 [Gracilaria vermiculophylla]QXU75151.1 ribosomal protein L20 [Gracilaria vermiculophylla]WDZ68010.1 ribosomal protein L20 [Gracilaria vermiculophylla]
MTRVKRGNIARKRRKKILKLAKGFRGSHSILFRTAKQQVSKALKYAYISRKNRKRSYRSLWIVRLNAAVRPYGITYNQFIERLKKNSIGLNRKMLSQLAILDHSAFQVILESCELRS